MANNTSQATVIVDVQVNQADAKTKAIELTNTIIALKDKQDILRASGQQLSVGYTALTKQIGDLVKQQQSYVQISQNEATSNNAKSAQLSLVTGALNKMSEAERNTTDGGKALTAQALQLKTALNEAGESIGNNTGKVGSYESAIKQAISSNIPFGPQLTAVAEHAGALTESLGGVGIAGTALSAVVIGLSATVAVLAGYLTNLTPVANRISQTMSFWKSTWSALAEDLTSSRSVGFVQLNEDMGKAGLTAEALTKQFQDLERQMQNNAVTASQYDTKIRALEIKLRRDIIDKKATDQAEDLKQIKQFEDAKYNMTKSALEATFKATVLQATNTTRITEAQQKDLLTRLATNATAVANKLNSKEGSGPFGMFGQKGGLEGGDEIVKRIEQIQKAYEANEQEKINREGRDDNREEQAKNRRLQSEISHHQKILAEQKKFNEAMDEAQKERQKTELNILAATVTTREYEVAEINSDIDQRKKINDKRHKDYGEKYKTYTEDNEALEKERTARINKVHKDFLDQDAKDIQTYLRQSQMRDVKNGTQTFGAGPSKEQADRLQNQFDLEDAQKQIDAIQALIDKGDKNQAEKLKDAIANRESIRKDGNLKILSDELEYQSELDKIHERHNELGREQTKLNQEQKKDEQQLAQSKIEMNIQLIQSYENLFGSIEALVGKNTAIGKAAFAIEKALSIARISLAAVEAVGKVEIQMASNPELALLYAIEIGAIIATAAASVAAIGKEVVQDVSAQPAQGHASGGYITGPGTGTSDSIPARLSNGEFVMTAQATKMFAPLLHDMNIAGGGKGFATGGIAGTYIPDISKQVNSENALSSSIVTGVGKIKNVVIVQDMVEALDKNAVTIQAGTF